MKLFKVSLCVLSLLFSSPLLAGNLGSDVEARYDAIKTWSADFNQVTYIEMLEQTLTKNGRISVARPKKLRIEYRSKPQKIYASNGKKLWVYKEDDRTAWQFNNPKKVISKEALSFLSGLKDMSSIFDVVKDLDDPKGYLKIKNPKLKKLYLIPKSRDAVLKMVLGINAKTLTVEECVLFNTSGNVTHYVFKNIEFEKELSAELFELPKKPKRKIIKK